MGCARYIYIYPKRIGRGDTKPIIIAFWVAHSTESGLIIAFPQDIVDIYEGASFLWSIESDRVMNPRISSKQT